jgi:peptidoglycan/xylan/chitin deacetylase (PgdA/CDA1 family)
VLEALGVAATFFLVGCRVRRHPELVAEILARGHSVQPHCWDHCSVHPAMARGEIERDIDLTLDALDMVGVATPRYWRLAGGRVKAPDSYEVARARGLRIAAWDVDPEDWRPERTAAVMLEQLLRPGPWRRRSIVLLHDGRINTPRRTAENTVALLEPLVDHLRAQGTRFKVLG